MAWPPHRTRYGQTARLDAPFREGAEQVPWCEGNAERLARQGVWTVAVEEVPSLPVLERNPPTRPHAVTRRSDSRENKAGPGLLASMSGSRGGAG